MLSHFDWRSVAAFIFILITAPIGANGNDPYVAVVTDYGAVADGQRVGGCSITARSNTVQCAPGTFTPADMGKTAHLQFAGTAAGCGSLVCPLLTIITGFVDSSTVTLADSANKTATNQFLLWGTDNTTAIQAAVDYADHPNVLEHDVYFPRNLGQPARGDPAPYQGAYMITQAIRLPDSTRTHNKYLKLYGDGYLSSTVQQLSVPGTIFEIQALGYGGTGTIIDALGMLGPPNYSTVNGPGILCDLCIQLQMTEDWMNGFQYDIEMAPNGQGTGSQGLLLNFNVFEEGVSAVYWPSGTGNALLDAVGNTVDVIAYGYTGGYAFDLNGVASVTIGDTIFGPGVGRGVRCVGCTSFKLHDNDFSLSASQVHWPGLWSYQNLYLADTSGAEINGNVFHSENAEAIDIAGGNTGVNFGPNTYTGTQQYMVWSGTGNNVTVSEQTVTNCASPCLAVPASSMSNSSISDNTYSPNISTPVSVTGGPPPAGSNVAMNSDDIAVDDVTATGDITGGTIQSTAGDGGNAFIAGETGPQARQFVVLPFPKSDYFNLQALKQGVGHLEALWVQKNGGPFGNGFGGAITTTGLGIRPLSCQAQPALTLPGLDPSSGKPYWAVRGPLPLSWQTGVQVVPAVVSNSVVIYLCNQTSRLVRPEKVTLNIGVTN